MGRPDLIKFGSSLLQPLQALNISVHVAMRSKHEYFAMALDRITADQHSGGHIQNTDTAGRMSGEIDDFQLPLTKVNRVALLHRNDGPGLSGPAVKRLLRGMHVK